jgi:hypothetical protein
VFTRWAPLVMSASQSAMDASRFARTLIILLPALLLLVGPARPRDPRKAAVSLPAAKWIELTTNACGDVGRIENRLSLTPAGISDEDDDEDEWVNAWNMSPIESEVLNEWMLKHPEIATVTGTVERLCEKPGPLDDPEERNLA